MFHEIGGKKIKDILPVLTEGLLKLQDPPLEKEKSCYGSEGRMGSKGVKREELFEVLC